MRVLRYDATSKNLKVRIDTIDDLWIIERSVFAGDVIKAQSERRFRPSEGDVGEMKEVLLTISVEKTEFDKNASRLRINGKILDAKPLEYVRLNTHHTVNIAPGDVIEIIKQEWRSYALEMIRNAVSDTKKPRLGVIVLDEEKALPAYLLGYGLQFGKEIHSGLSKRMSAKEFEQSQKDYYNAIITTAEEMRVDTVIIAGPGFTKDDVKDYMEKNGIKSAKKLIFSATSNAERSGVYELIKGESVKELLKRERIRTEFKLMEEFLGGLSTGRSHYGVEDVDVAIDSYTAETILVNDAALSNDMVKVVLAKAEDRKIKIEVFNSEDEVGVQLHGFNDVASIG